jgi:uncharacterized membrane protein
MFAFYEFNVMTIVVIFITAIIVYTLLDKNTENKNKPLSACSGIFIGVLLSFMISYLTLESDNLLTENYWE